MIIEYEVAEVICDVYDFLDTISEEERKSVNEYFAEINKDNEYNVLRFIFEFRSENYVVQKNEDSYIILLIKNIKRNKWVDI